MDIEKVITIVLATAGFITAIGGAVTYLKKWYNDSKLSKNIEILKGHDKQLNELDERVKKLESTKKWHDKYIEVMCKSMLAMLDHNINGNSIDKLKEAKEEMRDFFISKKGFD